MRNSLRPIAIILFLATTCTAFGAGGGPAPSPSPMQTREPLTPEDQARNEYNAGVRLIEKADELAADATHQADERKKAKARAKAGQTYTAARRKFANAAKLQPSNYQAWNYLGYANRRLGRYDEALEAYDHALDLKPDYAQAIEYRGHAYLSLNRLPEAKAAYLALFAGNRQLAATLLAAMQAWVGDHRGGTGDVDGATLASFASWVSERSSIASQTAALTREGAASAWHR
jgi:tetratricopeptide (TPR) repeat protein